MLRIERLLPEFQGPLQEFLAFLILSQGAVQITRSIQITGIVRLELYRLAVVLFRLAIIDAAFRQPPQLVGRFGRLLGAFLCLLGAFLQDLAEEPLGRTHVPLG